MGTKQRPERRNKEGWEMDWRLCWISNRMNICPSGRRQVSYSTWERWFVPKKLQRHPILSGSQQRVCTICLDKDFQIFIFFHLFWCVRLHFHIFFPSRSSCTFHSLLFCADETSLEAGIRVQIHSQDEPPYIHQLGFGVSPGFQTFVSCQEQRVWTFILISSFQTFKTLWTYDQITHIRIFGFQLASQLLEEDFFAIIKHI